MFFSMPEAEMLEHFRQTVEIPRAEQRARLRRELELTDPKRHAPHNRRVSWAWVSTARIWLGDGLTTAGAWLAGRGGGVL